MQSVRLTILCAAAAAVLYGYAEGPDAGVAGVPGEATCSVCHSGGAASGNVSVAFANGLSYAPGSRQHLIVTIVDTAQRRWGFQLTARQSGNARSQAGTFTPGSDGYTQLVCTQTTFQTENFGSCPASMPLQYIEHTLKGSRNGTRSPVTFEFDWTPPATNVGTIEIYVAANAANGDGNTGGDHIYTAHYTLSVAQPPPSNLPIISQVLNGASLQPGIAANSWVTIQGSNLANSSRPWNSSDFSNGSMPTIIDGVTVAIDGKPAVVAYVDPRQICVVSPADTAVGPVSVQVTNNGLVSAAGTAQLQSAAPALFAWSGKYVLATRSSDGSWVGPADLFAGSTTPAKPGDVVMLWSTGLDSTNPAPPTVTVGGMAANVISAGPWPGSAGLDQIAIQIPATVSGGDQAVVVQMDGVQSQAGVYLTIQQ